MSKSTAVHEREVRQLILPPVLPQAILGLPDVLAKMQAAALRNPSSPLILPEGEQQAPKEDRRDPYSVILKTVQLEEAVGMSPDQINESMTPIVDAILGAPQWETVQPRLSELSYKLTDGSFQDPLTERLEPFVDLTLSVAEQLTAREVVDCQRITRAAIYGFKDVDPVKAAQASLQWSHGEPFQHIPLIERPQAAPPHFQDFIQLIDGADFDAMGRMLHNGGVDPNKLPHLPQPVIDGMVECYEVAGYVKTSAKGTRLTQRGQEDPLLGGDSLKSSLLAYEFLNPKNTHPPIESMDQVKAIYAQAREADTVETVEVAVPKDSRTVFHLAEVLLGDSTIDIEYLDRVLTTVENLPAEMKPDIIIASGLMSGGFKYREKEARQALVLDVDEQLAGAKLILDRLAATGAKVIYNMSDRDKEIARDMTIDAMKLMQSLGGPISDQATYYEVDQLQQNPVWDVHRAFSNNIALEYCLRSGHSLRSAEEMASATGGAVKIHEYLVLFDAYQKHRNGEPIPDEYRSALHMDNIPFPGREFGDFKFVDDFNLETTIESGKKSKEIEDWVRYKQGKFGSKSMYRSPTDALASIEGTLESQGEHAPRTLVGQNQQLFAAAGNADGNWIVSSPGFSDPMRTLQQKGSIAAAGRNPAFRMTSTRRIHSAPGAFMQEIKDDGTRVFTFLDEKLLDKADASPDRHTAAFLLDWQTGSVTARADLQMKLYSMVMDRMRDQLTHLYFGGDIIQGRNYKGMPNENTWPGLIRIGDQVRFVKEMLDISMEEVTKPTLANLVKVGIMPGNHEWNSGYNETGDVYSDWIAHLFERALGTRTRNGPTPVTVYDHVATRYGDWFQSWTGFDPDAAGYGLLVQHMILERGAKGASGDMPVFQYEQLFKGTGDLSSKIDVAVSGHWHHPQMAMFGHKLALVAPSVAGESGYEWMRGYRAVVGGLMVHMGGGLPLQVEEIGATALHAYQIKSGAFSKRRLQQEGFVDDPHFDAARHGIMNPTTPKSGLQKKLIEIARQVVGSTQTEL